MGDERWDGRRDDEIARLRRGEVPPAVRVPLPERVEALGTHEPVTTEDAARAERPPWPAIVGTVALAVLACIPHLVAPVLALLVALVAAPLSWSMQRITTGRRRRAYLALAGALLVVAVLAIAAPLAWIELGIIAWPPQPPR